MALSGEDSFTEFGVPVLCDVHRATCLRKLDLLLVEYFVGHGLPDSPLQVSTFFLLSSPGLLRALSGENSSTEVAVGVSLFIERWDAHRAICL